MSSKKASEIFGNALKVINSDDCKKAAKHFFYGLQTLQNALIKLKKGKAKDEQDTLDAQFKDALTHVLDTESGIITDDDGEPIMLTDAKAAHVACKCGFKEMLPEHSKDVDAFVFKYFELAELDVKHKKYQQTVADAVRKVFGIQLPNREQSTLTKLFKKAAKSLTEEAIKAIQKQHSTTATKNALKSSLKVSEDAYYCEVWDEIAKKYNEAKQSRLSKKNDK